MHPTGPRLTLAAWAFLLLLTPLVLAEEPAASSASTAPESVRALFSKYCVTCHRGEKAESGFDLDKLMAKGSPATNRKPWGRLKEQVAGGTMPPEDHPQPAPAEVADLSAWIDGELSRIDCGATIDPGRVTIRRLNRVEYNNTIRDLTGVDFQPADDFPSDDVGYGFDNIGDVLSLPPILMEKYLAAAETIASQAIVVGGSGGRPPVKTYDGPALDAAGGSPHSGDGRFLGTNGEVAVPHAFPRDATYVVRVKAWAHQAGPEPARMAIRIDGKPIRTFDVKAVEGSAATYEIREKLRSGSRRISAAFLNDFYDPKIPDPKKRDRNLCVQSIEVEGPLNVQGDPLPASHKLIIFRTPKGPQDVAACTEAVLDRFLRRAYRRPVTGGEVAKVVRLAELARENGESFERGIQLAVQAVLASPQFLFRVELFRPKRDRRGRPIPAEGGMPLNDFEVASRLSYFLWCSMPDDELARLALEGKLLEEENLEKQARRMILDPKSRAFVESFAGQWLQLRNLKSVNPDRKQFKAFDEPLREAMQTESETFFASILRNDRPLLDFLDADYTYLNERLAKHYGIGGVKGPEFRRVALKGGERGGLITQASVLTVTSNPSRTSPVKRGKWVLEQILGSPPPPPPPDVPVLADDAAKGPLTGTLRQRFEQHRADPSCASCHARLDPPGFGLENFDAVGAWRDKDGGLPIDASAKLPTGESFRGPAELKAILRTRKQEFTRCLAEKMLTYALGRGLEEADACVVDKIVKNVAADQYKLSRMVLEIVKSEPFLRRRG